jgi:hypothetical protein
MSNLINETPLSINKSRLSLFETSLSLFETSLSLFEKSCSLFKKSISLVEKCENCKHIYEVGQILDEGLDLLTPEELFSQSLIYAKNLIKFRTEDNNLHLDPIFLSSIVLNLLTGSGETFSSMDDTCIRERIWDEVNKTVVNNKSSQEDYILDDLDEEVL